ncbi:MAG TPA: polysaccharide biosynthesis/export family protein [Thermoanaerobaculia bacterium]
MKKIAVHFWIMLLALSALAAAQGKEPAYRVGARDLLDIRVYEDNKLNGERRVTEAGQINLPLLGDVPVAGKTTAEVGLALKKLLEEKYMQKASVDVQVLEYRSRPISVVGAVKQPGNLGFSGRWTLLEALTAAGGLADSHGGVVHVLRRADNGLSDQVTISVNDLLVRGDPSVNIPIFANDLINVPVSVQVTIYCLGEVERAGALSFKSNERITLLTALAQAGGMTDRAAKGKIQIKRADSAQELTVDYNKIVAGKAPDVELKQGDVIVVKESFF